MKTLIASTALVLAAAQAASAQSEQPADDPVAVDQPAQAAPAGGADEEEGDATVGGAVGLATGAVGETFFIRVPQEYHLLTSEMPGEPVYLDTTSTGMQRVSASAPEAAGTAPEPIREGSEPLGQITDVVLDRRGGAAGLVIELAESMRGGAREVAVAMGLVRMLPDQENAGQTRILLSIDPIDLENAPTFERAGAAQGGDIETQPQSAAGASPQGASPTPQPAPDPAAQTDQGGEAGTQQ